MPVNTGPDSNNYSIPEVALNNTFNTWKDQSNLSAYKLNKLKVYSGVSSSSVSLTTTAAEGVLTAALLPTVLTGHTFSAGINGTQAAFHTFNAAGSTLTIGSNATAITMGVAGGSATILSHVTITGNFAVTGTQTITNSANFTIADAVISLGQTGGVGVTGASSRAQDRGIAFFYPDTDNSPGASLGFFGAKAGSRNLVYLLNGSTSGINIHSGVTGTFEGNFLGKDFRGVCGGSFVFTDSTGKTVGFRAPPAITTPTTWYLPVSDGTNGQLLGTNGAGQLVWDTAEPAGSTGMIQYNDGSGIAAGFSANSNLVFTVAGGLTGTTMSATLLRATGISAAGITTSGLVVTTGITYNGTIAQSRTGSTILPVRNQYKTTRAEYGPSLVLTGTTGDSAVASSTTNLFRYVTVVTPGASVSSGPFVIVLPPGTTMNPGYPEYHHMVKIHISGRNQNGNQTGGGSVASSTWECVVSGYILTDAALGVAPKWYNCDVQCTGRTPFTIVRTGFLDGGVNDVNNVSRTNAVIVLGDNTLNTIWASWSVDRIDIGYGGNFADQTLWEGQFLTSLYGTNDLISTKLITQGGTSTKKIIETSLTTMPVKLDVSGAVNAISLSSNSTLLVAPSANVAATAVLTTTPASIVGPAYTNGNFNGTLGLYGTEGLGVGRGAGIMFGGAYTSTNLNLLTTWAEVSGVRENATDGLYDGALVFKTRPSGGNIFERVRITSTGRVGIGTATPVSVLDVKDTISNAAPYDHHKVFKTISLKGEAFAKVYIKLFVVPANTTASSTAEEVNWASGGFNISGRITAQRSNNLSFSFSQIIEVGNSYIRPHTDPGYVASTTATLEAACKFSSMAFTANPSDGSGAVANNKPFELVQVLIDGVKWVCLYLNNEASAGHESITFDGVVTGLTRAPSKHLFGLSDTDAVLRVTTNGDNGAAGTGALIADRHTALGYTRLTADFQSSKLVVGEARSSISTTAGSNAKTLVTKDYVDSNTQIMGSEFWTPGAAGAVPTRTFFRRSNPNYYLELQCVNTSAYKTTINLRVVGGGTWRINSFTLEYSKFDSNINGSTTTHVLISEDNTGGGVYSLQQLTVGISQIVHPLGFIIQQAFAATPSFNPDAFTASSFTKIVDSNNFGANVNDVILSRGPTLRYNMTRIS